MLWCVYTCTGFILGECIKNSYSHLFLTGTRPDQRDDELARLKAFDLESEYGPCIGRTFEKWLLILCKYSRFAFAIW